MLKLFLVSVFSLGCALVIQVLLLAVALPVSPDPPPPWAFAFMPLVAGGIPGLMLAAVFTWMAHHAGRQMIWMTLFQPSAFITLLLLPMGGSTANARFYLGLNLSSYLPPIIAIVRLHVIAQELKTIPEKITHPS
jgi:hypothetical protein